jgi:hypothetical protein
MIERRLYYLQTRLDATPRSVPSAGTHDRDRLLGGRIHRLLGHRRSHAIDAAR